MSAQRVAMRNIKECLRLKFEGCLSHEKIARALQSSKGYVTAASATGLEWPVLAALDEVALAAALLPATKVRQTRGERVLPDLVTIHRDLRRKGITLQLLREEYVASHPEQPTYHYTQFIEHYRRYASTLKRSMARLRHQQFFSLDALNQAIAELLEDLNQRPFKKLDGRRRECFERLDQPMLRPLSPHPYEVVTIPPDVARLRAGEPLYHQHRHGDVAPPRSYSSRPKTPAAKRLRPPDSGRAHPEHTSESGGKDSKVRKTVSTSLGIIELGLHYHSKVSTTSGRTTLVACR